jgi:hypothetical protein
VDTFVARVQAVLQNDAGVSAWNDKRVIVEGQPDEDQAFATAVERGTVILIHTLRHRESNCPEHPQQIMRECQRFSAIVTVIQRAAIGIDPATLNDPAITGQPGMPGVIRMQKDVHAAFVGPTGAWNLLPDSAGTNYIWWWEFGEAGDPEPLDDEDFTYHTASREIIGHRWKNFA